MLENQNWDTKIRYNPHVYFDGEEIACQTIKEESTLNLDWRKKITFEGKLAPIPKKKNTPRQGCVFYMPFGQGETGW
jgi:hypothetical protein